ncbi:dehydrogenase [Apiospora marii]|uniref:Dehydrogenase n=1 Tax=Apiospora marii TaxID=335849 RepID=A0ABR1RUJ0_9PEZI
MLITHSYYPRVRGVADQRLIESSASIGATEPGKDGVQDLLKNDASALGTQVTDLSLSSGAEGEDGPSSWVQSLADIPYEDVISAHSVNTFVPLILIRELMPLMQSKQPNARRSAATAAAYIVNVSSREGLFEKKANSPAKNGKHVHTNMSKAGLNMITETEAYQAWYRGRVAMNTVDPGYMSAAPEFEQARGGERPLGWEDGAGRVLWPIAMGEKSRNERSPNPVWGRFLKHYGATRVDVRLGRG